MWLFLCCGEEAVGYSLYHRQSAGDVPQNLYLLTSDSWRFRVLQCCFHLAVKAGGREALSPLFFFLVERLLFHWRFFSVYVIIWMYWQPPRKRKSRVGRKITMSFKSFKDFGVSAERLGSICKRWMARVQRSVCKIVFTLVYLFCQSHNVLLRILLLCVADKYLSYHSLHICGVLVILGPSWNSSFLVRVVSYCVFRVMLYAYYYFCASAPLDGCSFASFLVSSAYTPVRKCLCASFCVWLRQRSCSCRYTGWYWFSLSLRLASKENGTI